MPIFLQDWGRHHGKSCHKGLGRRSPPVATRLAQSRSELGYRGDTVRLRSTLSWKYSYIRRRCEEESARFCQGKQVPGSAHDGEELAKKVDVCFLTNTDIEFDTVMEVLMYRQFLSVMEVLVYQEEVPSSGQDGTSS